MIGIGRIEPVHGKFYYFVILVRQKWIEEVYSESYSYCWQPEEEWKHRNSD